VVCSVTAIDSIVQTVLGTAGRALPIRRRNP